MDNFIVRIYRRDEEKPEKIWDVVEAGSTWKEAQTEVTANEVKGG